MEQVDLKKVNAVLDATTKKYLGNFDGGEYAPSMGIHKSSPPSADEVLQDLGRDFAATLPTNRKKAWNDVVMKLMTNLAVLKNENCSALRDIINIARDIDEKMGTSGTEKKSDEERLDGIGRGWVLPDVKAGAHGTT